MKRVVIAEDDLLVREGLATLIDAMDGLEVVGTCTDAAGLTKLVADEAPDVVITDIRMPPTHTDEGILAALELRRERPKLAIVVLSQYAEPEYVLALLADGSDGLGYLLKERVSDPVHLRRAIDSVVRGESSIDPKIIDVLIQGRRRTENEVDQLTPREAEVLALIAEGMNNAAIAEELVVGDKAVAKHINAIFSKFDLNEESAVHRRVKAVLIWLSQ